MQLRHIALFTESNPNTTSSETTTKTPTTTPRLTDGLDNIAVGKETTIYPDAVNNTQANFSVDGDRTSCVISEESETHLAVWTLNLAKPYNISRIHIYTLPNTCNYN